MPETTNEELNAAEKAAAEAEAQAAAAAAAKAAEPLPKYKEGDKVLVSACIADQVNPLTNQLIPHGQPVISLFDRWLEIQHEAGVVAFHNI